MKDIPMSEEDRRQDELNRERARAFQNIEGFRPVLPCSEKEAVERTFRLMTENNLAFILCDAAQSFFVDCERGLGFFGKGVSRSDKMKFNQLKRVVKQGNQLTKELGSILYGLEEADSALHDSDYYYNLIKLIEDRCGDNAQKSNLLLEFLLQMPSSGLFDVDISDFQRL